jgi:hypothetical protein
VLDVDCARTVSQPHVQVLLYQQVKVNRPQKLASCIPYLHVVSTVCAFIVAGFALDRFKKHADAISGKVGGMLTDVEAIGKGAWTAVQQTTPPGTTGQVSVAPLVDLRGLGAISVTTSEHAVG